jgi:hypothetical protein
VVRGRIADFGSSSGEGVVRHSSAYNKIVLGSGGNALKRASISLVTNLSSSDVSVERAYLDVGFTVPKDVILPLRVIIALDGVTITREFKPQIVAEMEEGVYGKVVYEVGGLLGKRLAERGVHTMNIVYSAAVPITFEDAGLTIIYKGINDSWHSMRFLSGAMVIEPGDLLAVDVSLPESRSEIKNLSMRLHIPSRFADISVEAADFQANLGGNIGNLSLETPIRFKGEKLRVYVNYKKPERKFYPKLALITSILLYESTMPEAFLDLKVEDVEKESEGYKIKCIIRNLGHVKPSHASVVLYALGVKLGEVKVDPPAPFEEREILLTINPSKISVPVNKMIFRILWSNYGIIRYKDVTVQI